eukprot:m.47893 g.47893  ORF g.47893 m.47893 type:complete len:156 (+) comp15742_c0_seq1:218-685(+)
MVPLQPGVAGSAVDAVMVLAAVASIGMAVSAAVCTKWCQKKRARLSSSFGQSTHDGLSSNSELSNPFSNGKHRTNPIFERCESEGSAHGITRTPASVITVPAPKVLEEPVTAPVGFDERAQRLAMMRQARQARKEEETNDLEASLSMIDNLDEDT